MGGDSYQTGTGTIVTFLLGLLALSFGALMAVGVLCALFYAIFS